MTRRIILLFLVTVLSFSCDNNDCIQGSNSCIQGPCGETKGGEVDLAILNATSLGLAQVEVHFPNKTIAFSGFDSNTFFGYSCWSRLSESDLVNIEKVTFMDNGIEVSIAQIPQTLANLVELDMVLLITEDSSGSTVTYKALIDGYTPCNDTPCI